MNRFGFSTAKKPLAERNNQDRRQSDFTPSLGPAPFSHGLSTHGKVSYGGNGGMAVPSTGKSIRSVGGGGFASSARKTPKGSRLFGMTPQQTRASFMNNPASSALRRTSTSSRVSRGGNKGDRPPLSDPSFHRNCQEKISGFLTSHNYPHQLTKQQLQRPSQADISRIFEFLFGFFATDGAPPVEIRNGPTTSIDVVVPKMLAELCYPYQLKRSDLVSFSGGRQLGAIYEAVCYVIDIITYTCNVDSARFSRPDEMDEFTDINSQLRAIASENLENEENFMNDEEEENSRSIAQLRELANSFFGTPNKIEELKEAQGPLEARLKNLEKEISRLVELPKEIQAYKEENDNYDKYLAEVTAKDADHQRMAADLGTEVAEKEAILESAVTERRSLQTIVDSQQELVVDYRLALERKHQIVTEMEDTRAAVETLNEAIVSRSLEVNNAKGRSAALINDLEEVIGCFFASLKSSKVNNTSAQFAASFEEDTEWRALAHQLAAYRDWTVEAPSDELIREVVAFGARFQHKFVDFKHRLLGHLTAFKGTASIELICGRQELAATLETRRGELEVSEKALKKLVAEKETTEAEGAAAIAQLNEAIEEAKRAIIADERTAEELKAEMAELQCQVDRLEATIKARRKEFMHKFVETAKNREAQLTEFVTSNEQLVAEGRAAIKEKEKLLKTRKNFNTKKEVVCKKAIKE